MSETDNQESVKTLKLFIELPKCLSSKKDVVEIEIALNETLPQLKETLGLIPRTENLTNLSIFYKDVNLLETFTETSVFSEILEALNLTSIESLNLKLVEKPYNLSAVYEHLLKFRQVIGLHFLDKSNMDFGTSGGVSKLSSLGLEDVKFNEPKTEKDGEAEAEEKDVEVSEEDKSQASLIADTLSMSKNADLLSLGTFPNPYRDFKLPIKSLTISQWSPVPQYQKTKGDLLYLSLQTLENESYQLTCHYSGFFVNSSSSATFNPQVKQTVKTPKHFILFELIRNLSPLFEKTIIQNSTNLHTKSKNPESYLLPTNSFTNYPWIVSQENLTNNPDLTQNQLAVLESGVGGDETIRDWNEEFQSIKELPRTTVNERILREKLINKTIHEFNKTATETAINIINGDTTSLNVSDDPEQLTFLKNGIFYSHAVDASGVFDSTGGNEAARYTSVKDLNTVKLLNRIDSSDVHNLLTLVVDYLGRRVVCQAPVAGIFQETRSIETDEVYDKVVYGLNSNGTEIVFNEKFHQSLNTITEAFHLKPHAVELDTGVKSSQDLATSKDMKGIQGTDGRKYMIDLYRSTPLDINFIEKFYQPGNPTSYPHKEALIRHEAFEEWWKRKIAVLIKEETEKLEKEGKTFEKEDGEKPKILVQGDQIAVNTDAFTGVNETEEDRNEVREVSNFVHVLIEEFLDEMSSQMAPFDGSHLSSMLHRSGINLRYLGYVAEQCLVRREAELKKLEDKIDYNKKLAEKFAQEEKEKKEKEQNKEVENKDAEEEASQDSEKKEEKTAGVFEPTIANYETVYRLAVQEMIARAAKHILRQLSASLPVNLISTFVTHYFNCLFGSKIHESPVCLIDEDLKSFYSLKDLQFTKLTSKDVINNITKEVLIRFRFDLKEDWISSVKPLQLFREISLKFGIQWRAQNYPFSIEEFENSKSNVTVESQVIESSKKGKKGKKHQSPIVEKAITRQTIFVPADIVDFIPIVKDSSYKPSLFDEVLETARVELGKDKKNGLILYNELLSFHEQIYGRVHSETAAYYAYLSQLYSELNLPYEASTLARVSCILSERTNGFDSYSSVTAYINSGYFESGNKDYINSLKVYEHAIKLWSSIYGDDHPSLITCYANLGELLTNIKLFSASKKLFEKSIDLSVKLNGDISEVTGLVRYRYGYTLLVANDYKAARDSFSKAYDIFVQVLGPKDLFTTKSLTFSTNLKTYLEYQKHEKAKKLEQTKGQKAPITKSSNSKKNKKKNALKINEDIASRSVDDIMAFIEGPSQKKK